MDNLSEINNEQYDNDSPESNYNNYVTASSESNESTNEHIFENGSKSRQESFSNQNDEITESYESNQVTEENGANENEDENGINDDKWKNQEKHIFILSEAGKPIYTLHGNEVNLISFMGLMQALVSIIECDNGNRLKYIKSGEHTIVFMHRDHLIFVSVSSEKGKCPEQLYNELNFIYSQIVSVVTLSLINRIFKTHHNYDLRNKLSGTEKLIGNLVKRVKNDHGMLLNCLSVQPLAFEIREQIAKLIVQSIEASSVNYILFAILFYENKLVAVIRQKNKSLNPTDIHLLVNVITNSEALKASAFIWYPICLPNFNSSCVMNSYITLLDEKVCLVLLAGSCDHDQMMKLNDISSRIRDKMTSNSLLNTMHIKLNESEKALELVDISELRHFLFKDRVLLQYFVTDYSLPYTLSPEEQQRLFDIYQNLYHKLHRSFNSLRFVYICQKYETILGWFTTEFEIYATFSPITTKERIINAANRLLEYIIKNKNKLFITTMPTLNIKS